MRARCDGEEPAPAELASDGGRTQTKGVRTLEPMKPGLAEAARPLSAAHQLAAGALPVAPRLPVAWHHASESRAFRSIDRYEINFRLGLRIPALGQAGLGAAALPRIMAVASGP
jgi:hypothetical protein